MARVREPRRPRCSQAVCRWRGKWACLFKTLTLPSSSSAPTDCFFFPWNHLSSLSLSRPSIFSLAPNVFYAHVSICTSEDQWASKRKKGKTEWTHRGGGCWVLGPSVWVRAMAGGPCAHMYVWECLPAGHPVEDTEVCLYVFGFFFLERVFWVFLNPFQINLYEESHDWGTNCFFFSNLFLW